MVLVLDPAGEGRDPALPGLDGPVGLGVLVDEDESPAREVSPVVGEIEETGVVE